jgi:hypothetical protein
MGYEEKYCIWSSSSLGGCPLEGASEQERIPSIIGSIVWCCPTSKVFYTKTVVSSILISGSIVYPVFVVIVFVDLLGYLTIGIGALSLAKIVGNFFFFYFCRFFRI